MIIWEGTLTDGTDALAISPGVWEDDLNALAFSGYVKAQFAAQGPLWQNAQILAQATQPVPAAPINPPSVTQTLDENGMIIFNANGGSAPPQLKPIVLGNASQSNAAGPESPMTASFMLPVNQILGERRDRPIGIASAGGTTAILPNTVLVLTREILEKHRASTWKEGGDVADHVHGYGHAVGAEGGHAGDYVMYLSVERETGT